MEEFYLRVGKERYKEPTILGKNETEFSYSGAMVFEDLETGQRVKVNAKEAKEHYLNAMDENQKKLKNSFLAKDIGHDLFRCDRPMQHALQFFLKRRNSLS